MDFPEALTLLKDKSVRRIRRTGWNGKNQSVCLQESDSNSKMNAPYLYIETTDGTLIPWVASQADMLAEDWVAIK